MTLNEGVLCCTPTPCMTLNETLHWNNVLSFNMYVIQISRLNVLAKLHNQRA